jgi:hypothetical protein
MYCTLSLQVGLWVALTIGASLASLTGVYVVAARSDWVALAVASQQRAASDKEVRHQRAPIDADVSVFPASAVINSTSVDYQPLQQSET